MIEIQAPKKNTSKFFSIFLAGSIDMNQAEKWQSEVVKQLADYDVALLNPRRDDWDSTWKQTVDDKNFSEQVNWELDQLEACDLVFLYFSADSKAPISLLELGLHANSKKMIVCCPDKYWRKGNVEIVCTRSKVPLYNDFDAAMAALKKKVFAYGR